MMISKKHFLYYIIISMNYFTIILHLLARLPIIGYLLNKLRGYGTQQPFVD